MPVHRFWRWVAISVPFPLCAYFQAEGSVYRAAQALFLSSAQTASRRKGQKMKITWKFADDTVSTVEVDEKVGTLILDSRRKEENAERRHRRHCWSLDAITYEGKEYGAEDSYDFGEADLTDKHVTLCGTVSAGALTHVEVGAAIKNNISARGECVLGAVVMESIDKAEIFMGVPAIRR